MKLLSVVTVLAGTVATVLGQFSQMVTPSNGDVLNKGQSFTAQLKPINPRECFEVAIVLALNTCNNEGQICPKPSDQLGDILYSGPWTSTAHNPGGFYQNFTLEVPAHMISGPAVVSFANYCLRGSGPTPYIEYGVANVTIA